MKRMTRAVACLAILTALAGCGTPPASGEPDGGVFPDDPCNGVPEQLCPR